MYQENQSQSKSLIILEDYLEKTMVSMPIEHTERERRNYLAGIIDCLGDIGTIDEIQREKLYLSYVG